MEKFKIEILKKIKEDPDLFAEVAKALEIKPVSLPQLIDRRSPNLNQYSIVKLVADYLGVNPEDLMESVEDTPNVIQS
jgi:hypothetical protein